MPPSRRQLTGSPPSDRAGGPAALVDALAAAPQLGGRGDRLGPAPGAHACAGGEELTPLRPEVFLCHRAGATGGWRSWFGRGAARASLRLLLVLAAVASPLGAGAQTPPREIALEIPAGDVILAGLLRLPAGEGPAPAVVLLHGSDPAKRRDAAYRIAGDAFLRAGFAVLSTDKRGVGDSGGDQAARFERLASDAVAAVVSLRQRPEISESCVGLWGKSQGGGWVGPLAASQLPDLAFLIAASAPLEPLEPFMHRFLGRRLAEEHGLSAEQVARVASVRSRIWDYLASGAGYEAAAAELRAVQQEDWLPEGALPARIRPPGELAELSAGTHAFLADRHFDPLPVVVRLTAPTLFLYGSEDDRLPVAEYRAELASLAGRSEPSPEVVVLRGADHDLRTARDNDGVPASEALQVMASWALQVIEATGACTAVSRHRVSGGHASGASPFAILRSRRGR